MAIVSQTFILAPDISYTIQFDDVSMLMTSLVINNTSNRHLYFQITSPKALAVTFPPNTVTTYSIPTAKRPTWAWRNINDPILGPIKIVSGWEGQSNPVEGE